MTINTELMSLVRFTIEEHPSRHRQTSWVYNIFDNFLERFPVDELRQYAGADVPNDPIDQDNPVCGTQACVAGWAAILSAPSGSILDGSMVNSPDGTRRNTSTWAQEALGLTNGQAEYLFSAYRTQGEVIAALAYLPDHPQATAQELVRECGDEWGEYGGKYDDEEDFDD